LEFLADFLFLNILGWKRCQPCKCKGHATSVVFDESFKT